MSAARFLVLLCITATGCVAPVHPGGPTAASPAPCSEALAFVVSRLQANYPGFADKVTDATRELYLAHTAAWTDSVAAAPDGAACHRALAGWADFFRDRHVAVIDLHPAPAPAAAQAGDTSAAAIRARFAGAPSLPVAEADARRLWAGGAAADPLVGIYQQWNGPYRLAIVPHPRGGFAAVVLRADSVWWVPGQVKAWFTPRPGGGYDARFRMRDHREERTTASLVQNLLKVRLPGGESWFLRLEPRGPDDLSLEEFPRTLTGPTRFERLSARTVALHVADFYGAAALDSVLARHRGEITGAQNLIIDVQSNPGGSDHVFAGLLPMLYTDPIVRVPHAVLATPDNIAKFQGLLEAPGLPPATRDDIRGLVERLHAAPAGSYVRTGTWEPLRLDSVLPLPARVAVVVGRGCGSSCEQFVLAARQSRKVTVYGENTAGVADYGNTHFVDAPGGRYRLVYPTSRSERLPGSPVDPHGIVPDVSVPAGELYPVRWVQRLMERG